ncbi:MAG: serine hydrolase, partial [Opitutaceae bacterium]
LEGAATAEATLAVPADAAGKTIHVILALRDNGTPPLVGYRRLVFDVRADAAAAPVLDAKLKQAATPAAPSGLLPAATTSQSPRSPSPLPGQIVIDPENPQWLERHGGPHLFICGPGDPEDFLYRGVRNPDGTRRGDQAGLIDKLIRHGGNCIYVEAVRTHGGDAKPDATHNPFVDSDSAKGLDERILEQWEEWFARMDAHGILIYFFFYDDGARIWNTGDVVGPEERAFVEGIVRRFQHHKNLIWIVGEESEERYTTARVQAVAQTIRRADAHGHIIGNHHLSTTTFKAWQPGGALQHYSMQLNLDATAAAAHAGAVEAWRKAAGRYQVIYSECTTTPPDVASMRRHAWAVAMAGAMPMLLQMDIAGTPVEALQQCRRLQQFFEATDFYAMSSHDELAHAATSYVLADPGRSYLAYADQLDGDLGLKALPAGKCFITWLDCITGESVAEQRDFSAPGDRSFRKPRQLGRECAAWIRFPALERNREVAAGTPGATRHGDNRPPVAEDREIATRAGSAVYVQLAFTDDDGPGPYSYTIVQGPQHGSLSGENNDRTYTPAPGFTGEDRFTWKASDGVAESNVGTVTFRVRAGPDGGGRPTGYFPVPESQGGWRQLERAEDIRRIGGMDTGKLAELRQWLLGSDQRNFAATVVRHGHIVLEVERGNSAKTDARRVASVSKAVCATVLAIASELSQQGKTPRKMTFADPAFQFIPWAQPLSDPRKAQITVQQLFNTTSGIGPESTGAPGEGTWDYVLGHTGDARLAQLAFDPGTASGYSSHALYHAALVCENVTGVPYDRFAIEHLFKPLGCEHWWFQRFDSEKHGARANHSMGMPARDLARIAYCMLRGGDWNGRQVIPRWFVDDVANGPTHALRGVKELRWGRDAANYSHAWELPTSTTTAPEPWSKNIPKDARFKRGSGGQFIAYVPSLDLVVARQTGGSGQWAYEEYLSRVCQAVLK